jgi:hypothetical protein
MIAMFEMRMLLPGSHPHKEALVTAGVQGLEMSEAGPAPLDEEEER